MHRVKIFQTGIYYIVFVNLYSLLHHLLAKKNKIHSKYGQPASGGLRTAILKKQLHEKIKKIFS